MKLVCACTGDEAFGEYNYAVIELPFAYLEWLLCRLRVSKDVMADESDFYAVEYFDDQANYFESLNVDFDVEHGEFTELPDSFTGGVGLQRTAARTVAVTSDSVVWKGHPKHSGGKFETATMTEAELVKLRVNWVG